MSSYCQPIAARTQINIKIQKSAPELYWVTSQQSNLWSSHK